LAADGKELTQYIRESAAVQRYLAGDLGAATADQLVAACQGDSPAYLAALQACLARYDQPLLLHLVELYVPASQHVAPLPLRDFLAFHPSIFALNAMDWYGRPMVALTAQAAAQGGQQAQQAQQDGDGAA
jgi:hypothetical protein